MSRKKILFITHTPPGLTSGIKIREYYLIKHLSKNHDIGLLTSLDGDEKEINKYCEVYTYIYPPENRTGGDRCDVCDGWESGYCSRLKCMKSKLKELFLKPPSYFNYSFEEAVLNKYKEVINSKQYDCVITEFIPSQRFIGCLRGLKVLDLYDLAPLKYKITGNNRLGDNLINRLLNGKINKYVRGCLKDFDLVLSVSEKEAAVVSVENPNVLLAENGVNVSYFKDIQFTSNKNLLFIGTLDYWPNEEGITRFINEQYGKLRRYDQNIGLNIVGKRPGKKLKDIVARYEGIKLYDRLADIREVMRVSYISLVPIYSGSGTRIKILESMAACLPVVSTAKGAEGLRVTDKKDIFIAESHTDFRDRILALMSDRDIYNTIKYNALQTATSYSWAAAAKKIDDKISELYAR